jgi:hypothetical protein
MRDRRLRRGRELVGDQRDWPTYDGDFGQTSVSRTAPQRPEGVLRIRILGSREIATPDLEHTHETLILVAAPSPV